MNASRAIRLLVVAVVGLAAIASQLFMGLSSPSLLTSFDSPAILVAGAIVWSLWLAAALVALARQPSNPMWALLAAYVVIANFGFAVYLTPYPVLQGLSWMFADALGSVLLVHILVAYPTGHLRTAFDRRLVLSVYAIVLGVRVLATATWQPVWESCPTILCPENILLVWPNNELSDAVTQALNFAAPVIGAAVLWAIWRHWRAAGPAARRVLLPVVVAAPFYYVTNSLWYLGGALGSEALMHAVRWPSFLFGWILPVGLLIGVLRLQLERGRVAGLVVELGRGMPAGGLRDALARALGDPSLQLAFATPGAAGYIDGAGRPVELPAEDAGRAVARIDQDGEPLAVLVHDRTIDEEDPGLVEAVSSAALLAIENERLTAQVRAQLEEVRASRVRIVEAADEERRKVERDLHDGAQQRLVALAMRLEQARATNEGSARLIDEATAELREAIAEVRGLARGLYPPILTEAGMAAAVESLAERASLPVEVRIPEDRFPTAVEITAYFVVAEALTNVTRHAGATTARVEATVAGDALTVTVTDDGRGGADPARGTGLQGLDDRVAAIGGSFEVISAPGEGTTVRVRLPLGSADR